VPDHDDDHRHDQLLAPGWVRGPGDGAGGHRPHPQNTRFTFEACGRRSEAMSGCIREGLHEGVRRGLPEGIRPASDPSPGAITPGHAGGGGSTVSADLRG